MKKVLSLLLVLLMVLSLLPAAALATGEEETVSGIEEELFDAMAEEILPEEVAEEAPAEEISEAAEEALEPAGEEAPAEEEALEEAPEELVPEEPALEGADGHQNHSSITNWQGVSSLPNTKGNYYLTADVEISSTWKPADGTVLCLNGHSITMTGNDDVIYVEDKSVFTLYDCGGTGKITHASGKTGSGVDVRGTFNMYGGCITGNTASYGAGVCNGTGGNAGTFNMYGGSITGNTATNSTPAILGGGFGGGGVYNYAYSGFSNHISEFHMYGGSITNNTNGGVNVLVNGVCSKISIQGNVNITNNTNYNVRLGDDAQIEVTGALDSASRIGVTMVDANDYITNKVNFAQIPNAFTLANFTSDDNTKAVTDDITGVNHRLKLGTALTGTLTISGTAKVGETLTAVLTGGNSTNLRYQWYRGEEPITSATGSTYTLVDADAGQTIKVVVTATDKPGEKSAQTTVMGSLSGKVSISGTATVNQTLTANVTDANTTNLLYQWYRGEDKIDGATGKTYTLVSADVGKTMKVVVTATDKTGSLFATTGGSVSKNNFKGPDDANPDIKVSGYTGTYDKAAHGITVTLQNNASSGATITYSLDGTNYDFSNQITDATAAAGTTVYYKVSKADYNDYVGTAVVTIGKASQNTPSVSAVDCTSGDNGQITGVSTAMEYKLSTASEWTPVTNAPITGLAAGTYNVRVAGDNNHNPSAAATVTVNPALSLTVTIGGELKFGSTLTANLSGTDATNPNLAYQWYRGADKITGATAKTYVPVAEDIGKTLKVVVTATNRGGKAEATVSGTIDKADGPAAPSASDVKATDCTTIDNNDGTLVGVTAAMEYRLKTTPVSDWTTGTGSTITGRTPGDYEVRVKETATTKAGEILTVTVKPFIETKGTAKLTVGSDGLSLTASLDGYTGSGTLYYTWYTSNDEGQFLQLLGRQASDNTFELSEGNKYDVRVKITASDCGGSSFATVKNINNKDISAVLNCDTWIYNGSSCNPYPTVTDNGTPLSSNTDYYYGWLNNIPVGTGSVVLTGQGGYCGIRTLKFTIRDFSDIASPKSFGPYQEKKVDEDAVLSIAAGTVLDNREFKIKVKLNGKELTEDNEYEVNWGSSRDTLVDVTLKKGFLNRLSVGEHKLSVEFYPVWEGEPLEEPDYVLERTIVITAEPVAKKMPPKSGDDTQLGLWMVLMGTSVLALGAVVISKKRKQN